MEPGKELEMALPDPRLVHGKASGASLSFWGGPVCSWEDRPEDCVHLDDDDALFFIMAMYMTFPEWNIYTLSQEVSQAQWGRIFEDWETAAYAHFHHLVEAFCEIDYRKGTFTNTSVMYVLCHNAPRLLELQPKESQLYRSFRQWAEKQFAEGHKVITVYGI